MPNRGIVTNLELASNDWKPNLFDDSKGNLWTITYISSGADRLFLLLIKFRDGQIL